MMSILPVPIEVDDENSFDPHEATLIVRDYVCAVCYGPLVQHYIPNERRVIVACQTHGNCTVCGRVTHATVGIEGQRGLRLFNSAIRNLPDLWGDLIPPKKSDDELLKDLGF